MRMALNSGKTEMESQEKPLWKGHEDELAKLCGLR